MNNLSGGALLIELQAANFTYIVFACGYFQVNLANSKKICFEEEIPFIGSFRIGSDIEQEQNFQKLRKILNFQSCQSY